MDLCHDCDFVVISSNICCLSNITHPPTLLLFCEIVATLYKDFFRNSVNESAIPKNID